ncbi:MAG TPA: hypothetical protein VN974_13475 [Candidatus Dormibacteraeota bacterium]|nr:hypothetical protein [Candidatus Dormibacteraeota bacterium]
MLRRSLASIFVATMLLTALAAAQTLQREDEIVASLAGGRVIAQVAKDNVIIFAAINQPVEQHSVPPRLLQLDALHVGVLLGASEWQIPSAPNSVRLDRDYQSIVQGPNQHYAQYPGQEAPDLETIGIAFLEKLRPLVAQLHHKLDFRPDDALFELIILGFAPDYGPEVWQVEYRIEQEQVAARGEYWQTRILRPRFTQLYPPEGGKKAPHTLVEARYPPEDPAALASKVVTQNTEPPLIALIQAGDPALSRLRSGDPKFAKVMDAIDHGQAQKASATDSADFLRAALPLIAGGNKFFLGTMVEQRGFDWIVPPDEPVEKTDDKSRPPSAPSLRRKPTP